MVNMCTHRHTLINPCSYSLDSLLQLPLYYKEKEISVSPPPIFMGMNFQEKVLLFFREVRVDLGKPFDLCSS